MANETELRIGPAEPDTAAAAARALDPHPADDDAGEGPPRAPIQSLPRTPSPAPPQAPGPSIPLLKISPRKFAANRANAQKSTGPRTSKGKERAKLNGYLHVPSRPPVRLLGLAEARTLRQEPGSADRLYQELIAPYEPAPALLKMHFQDLARLHLELEAWERIRDAQLEHRWQQNDVERRRRYQEMERDLPAAQQQLEQGLCRVGDSPAKFKRMAEYFVLLKQHLERRNFDVGNIPRMLYGSEINPGHDRAQIICIRCQKLMSGKGPNVLKRDLDLLIGLVETEYRNAMNAYLLKLDESTMTRFACLAGLGVTTVEEQRMHREGQALRQAFDRKQRVINSLMRTLGLSKEARLAPGPETTRARNMGALTKNERSEPTRTSESAASKEHTCESNPPKATRARRSRR